MAFKMGNFNPGEGTGMSSALKKTEEKKYMKIKRDLVHKSKATNRKPQSQMTDEELAAQKGIKDPQTVYKKTNGDDKKKKKESEEKEVVKVQLPPGRKTQEEKAKVKEEKTKLVEPTLDHEIAHDKMNKEQGDVEKQSPVWSDKATRLVNKRTRRQDKGKDTSRVQKKINKELAKLNKNK